MTSWSPRCLVRARKYLGHDGDRYIGWDSGSVLSGNKEVRAKY